MKDIQIKCNTKDEVVIDDNARINGISVALVDEKQYPVAKYEFSGERISKLTRLLYDASNVRIRFYGDITPTMISETISANDYQAR